MAVESSHKVSTIDWTAATDNREVGIWLYIVVKIPTISTMTSSTKVATSECNNERQPITEK